MSDIDILSKAIEQTTQDINELAASWSGLKAATLKYIEELEKGVRLWKHRAQEAENALTDAVTEASNLRTELNHERRQKRAIY